jgi:hypothetical protein
MKSVKDSNRLMLRKELVPILVIKILFLVMIKILFFTGETASPQAVEQSIYGIHSTQVKEANRND